jgi:hypothetical protein
VESEGSPDPFWIAGNLCLVFEDYTSVEATTPIDVKKARQVACHPKWIKAHVPGAAEITVVPVLLSKIDTMHPGAEAHLADVGFWAYDEFLAWARQALTVVRELRRKFTETGDLVWRADAAEAVEKITLDARGLFKIRSANIAAKALHRK